MGAVGAHQEAQVKAELEALCWAALVLGVTVCSVFF